MATENEDDNEVSGPPPDPSIRAWRHPSEVAAANAAAARGMAPLPPQQPPRHRRWSPHSFGAGGVFGALLAIAAVVSTTPFNDEPDTRVEFRPGPTAEPVEANEQSDETQAGATSQVGAAINSTTTVLASTTVVSGLLDRNATIEPPVDEVPGVFGLFHLDGTTPVATAVLLDGRLLTSASALGGAERFVYVLDGEPREATVYGTDRFTDVAVLVPDDPIDAPEITPAEARAEAGDDVRLVATDGQPPQILVAGRLIATDKNANTKDGHAVIGAMYTSARVPEAGGGAALVNDRNEAIGLVIDSDDYLAIAIPLAIAREIGDSIIRTGWGHQAWIGIEGSGEGDGIVLTSVGPESPAGRAGLAVDDIIVSCSDEPVTNMADLVRWLRSAGPGEELQLGVTTDGLQWNTTVVIGSRPEKSPDDRQQDATDG